MSRKITFYYCDICNREYGNEEAANNCEKEHLMPTAVDKPEFSLKDDFSKKEYPESVLIHFVDGNGHKMATRYYRESKCRR